MDRCEVAFLVVNAILTETIRRKAWIVSDVTVIIKYIIMYWNELRSFIFKAQVSPALMSTI